MVSKAQSEAEKMAAVPGIYFADEHDERVPKVAGSGLGVWEIVQIYVGSGRDMATLRRAFPWLEADQLGAALAYYAEFPAEIDAAIAENEASLAEA